MTRQSGRIDARRVSSAALVRWSSRVRRVGFLKNPILQVLELVSLIAMAQRFEVVTKSVPRLRTRTQLTLTVIIER